ncbi:hypothetical protein GGI42DRAFT_313201 [Trichoderma sp. SZMC 28013]
MTYVGDGLHSDPCCCCCCCCCCCSASNHHRAVTQRLCFTFTMCCVFCHPAETGSRVEIEFVSHGAINVNGCSALTSLAPETTTNPQRRWLASPPSASPLLRRVVSCRPSLHRRRRREEGLRRRYTKHPSEAIISYDSSRAYSRTLSPGGPLSNLIVSAPTPPLAPIHAGGEASRCRSLLLSLAAGAHVDSRLLPMSALAPGWSSCKLTSGCTSTSSFALVKACLTQKDERYSSWENRLSTVHTPICIKTHCKHDRTVHDDDEDVCFKPAVCHQHTASLPVMPPKVKSSCRIPIHETW